MALKKPRLRKNEGKAHFERRVAAFNAQFLTIPEIAREPTAEELKPGLPLSLNDMRKSMLAEAGVTPKLFEKAIKRLDEQLSASKTQYFAHEGEVVSERNTRDNAAVQKAIDTTLDLFGAKPARNDAKGGGDVQVNVVVAPWMTRGPERKAQETVTTIEEAE